MIRYYKWGIIPTALLMYIDGVYSQYKFLNEEENHHFRRGVCGENRRAWDLMTEEEKRHKVLQAELKSLFIPSIALGFLWPVTLPMLIAEKLQL